MGCHVASFPCLPGMAQVAVACPHFRYSTPEEIYDEEVELQRADRQIESGRSPCCDAALVPVGGGWEACSRCDVKVIHRCAHG